MKCQDFKGLEGKTVLVIDDEEIVVDVIREAMSAIGSSVSIAANGIEALKLAMESDFDYILLDIEMPKMNGKEFYKYLSEIKPHLLTRIIFITGDVETESTRTFINRSGCRYIDKPFMLTELFKVMTCA